MKKFVLLTALIFPLLLNATCLDLNNSQQALGCLQKHLISQDYGQGELTNSVAVANDIPAYEAIITLAQEKGVSIDLENSLYVGVVMIHYDDDPIHYFSLEMINGKVEIVHLFKFYMVDVEYEFPKNINDPLIFSLYMMDIEGWHYDFFEELTN